MRATALSYCSRLSDAETFSRMSQGETYRRGTARAGVVCAVMDGATWTWLQEWVSVHRADAVRMLDFPHAAQHLALVGAATSGAGSAAATAWLDVQCHTLKHETHGGPHPCRQARGETRCCGIWKTRREQIAYARFTARGHPIGSGMVESANKLVVEAQLKGERHALGTGTGEPDGGIGGRWRAGSGGMKAGRRGGGTELRRARPVAAQCHTPHPHDRWWPARRCLPHPSLPCRCRPYNGTR